MLPVLRGEDAERLQIWITSLSSRIPVRCSDASCGQSTPGWLGSGLGNGIWVWQPCWPAGLQACALVLMPTCVAQGSAQGPRASKRPPKGPASPTPAPPSHSQVRAPSQSMSPTASVSLHRVNLDSTKVWCTEGAGRFQRPVGLLGHMVLDALSRMRPLKEPACLPAYCCHHQLVCEAPAQASAHQAQSLRLGLPVLHVLLCGAGRSRLSVKGMTGLPSAAGLPA